VIFLFVDLLQNFSSFCSKFFVSGDFFVSVPAGADAYLLSRVIHDWDDEKAVAILKVVRGAIAPHGKLVLLETMLRPTESNVYPVLSDLNMLIVTGGCERTEAEYHALYRAAGFELTKTVLTKSPTDLKSENLL
jgi:O-methyltransferase domain